MARKHIGVVMGTRIEVRFAFSGKITAVRKRTGDLVKRGELLAALDRKVLQAELDRQLADYEIQRAEFDRANKSTDYSQKVQQARLNASVKEVELAKAKLDQVDLFSPVSGIVLDDGSNVVGLNVTPSSSAFVIVDTDSLKLRIEISELELDRFLEPHDVQVKLASQKSRLTGTTTPARPSVSGKQFTVDIVLPSDTRLIPGMTGQVS